MRKKTCILAIGIILLLEGIFLPCVLLNKFPANAINGITAETQKAASANLIAADNYDSIKDNPPAARTRNPAPQNKTVGNKKIRKQAKKIYRKNKQILVLVNADHALEKSYQANLRPICNGRLNASDYLYPSLVKMLADASESGFTYWIASAWRSREKQQKLIDEDVRIAMQKGLSYDDALSDTYKETMPAGHSEHETGLALDILCSGNMNMDTSQAEEAGNIWLRENCFRYGFILRYPEEQETITGVHYEPWHLRYVGTEAAKFLHRHNLTLEEFWQLL